MSHTTESGIGNNFNHLLYRNINYFRTKELAEKVQKMQLLQRKLYKFSMENGGNKIDWDNIEQSKYFINYTYYKLKQLNVVEVAYNRIPNQIYFISKEAVEQAIEKFKKELLEFY